jgi:hypothetical protein
MLIDMSGKKGIERPFSGPGDPINLARLGESPQQKKQRDGTWQSRSASPA